MLRIGRDKYRKLRRLVGRSLTVALYLFPLAAVSLWLALAYRPGWYQPPTLSDADLVRAHSSAISRIDFVSDRIVAGMPFEVELTERELNEWLAILPNAWPAVLDKLPPEIRHPVVRLGEGSMLLGMHYSRSGWQSILSVSVTLSVASNGESVQVQVTEVHSGAVPVPGFVVDRILGLSPEGGEGQPASEPRSSPNGAEVMAASHDRIVHRSFDYPNRFIWFNGKRPFRIAALTVEPGLLRLRLDPL